MARSESTEAVLAGGQIRQINRDNAARLILRNLADYRRREIRRWRFGTHFTLFLPRLPRVGQISRCLRSSRYRNANEEARFRDAHFRGRSPHGGGGSFPPASTPASSEYNTVTGAESASLQPDPRGIRVGLGDGPECWSDSARFCLPWRCRDEGQCPEPSASTR